MCAYRNVVTQEVRQGSVNPGVYGYSPNNGVEHWRYESDFHLPQIDFSKPIGGTPAPGANSKSRPFLSLVLVACVFGVPMSGTVGLAVLYAKLHANPRPIPQHSVVAARPSPARHVPRKAVDPQSRSGGYGAPNGVSGKR